MKVLRNLEIRLNDELKDYNGARNFGVLWRKHLGQVPWADLDSVHDPLNYANGLVFPVYQVQYDSSNGGAEEHFLVHHSSWSGDCGLKPSEQGIRELFELLGMSYEDLMEETENLPSLFHDYFYKGPDAEFENEPPIPLLVRRLVDRTLGGLYWDIYDITSQQWALQLNLKISNIFSNRPLKIAFDISAMDNGALAEGFWAISYFYPLKTVEEREALCPKSLTFPPNSALNSFNSRLDNLLEKYNSKVNTLFTDRDLLRTDLPNPSRPAWNSSNRYVRPLGMLDIPAD